MVAENGETLLEAELEPVTAGDPGPGPIVKIFMRDDRLYMRIIRVCCCRRRGKNIFVIKNVQPLVLHRANVEIRDRDDVKNIEIIFAPIEALVPGHGAFQSVHRISGLGLLAALDMDAERNFAAGPRCKFAENRAKIAAYQSKEIARLWMRVVP